MADKSKLGLIEEHSKKLEDLRKERESISADLYQNLDSAEQMFSKWESMSKEDVEGEMSKLDAGLSQYGDYRQTIADLAEGRITCILSRQAVGLGSAILIAVNSLSRPVQIFGLGELTCPNT